MTGLYEWDPYEVCQIDVETLIEIGPALFHKVREPVGLDSELLRHHVLRL